jgi:hypothetical protein
MNNEQHNMHPTVFLFIIMLHSPNIISFLLPNSSFVIDLCAEVFGTVGDEPPIISKKSKERLQNKLDNIRHKVNIVKDNKAQERLESVFATYAVAKMAFTRAISNGSQRKRHGDERGKSRLDFDVDDNGGRKKTRVQPIMLPALLQTHLLFRKRSLLPRGLSQRRRSLSRELLSRSQ